jgi:hypothetical protein
MTAHESERELVQSREFFNGLRDEQNVWLLSGHRDRRRSVR